MGLLRGNTHLNGFTIDTHVKDGAVHLTGRVESAIDRDLAGELAKRVDEVNSVDNDQVVGSGAAVTGQATGGSFARWVDDATTTAEEKQLAGQIARNTADVTDVHNKLMVN